MPRALRGDPTPARILVVEDDERSLQLVRDILEHRGFEVVEARTVAEGGARLRESPPDLVLMDVQVPGGGGATLLEEIRRERSLARTPVIAMTAFAMQGDRERLLRAGFDGYLSKPIDTRAFGAEIEAYLKKRGGMGVS